MSASPADRIAGCAQLIAAAMVVKPLSIGGGVVSRPASQVGGVQLTFAGGAISSFVFLY